MPGLGGVHAITLAGVITVPAWRTAALTVWIRPTCRLWYLFICSWYNNYSH